MPEGKTVGSKLMSRHGPFRSAWICCTVSVPTSTARRSSGLARVRGGIARIGDGHHHGPAQRSAADPLGDLLFEEVLVKVRIAEGRRATLSTQVVRWGCPLAGTCPLQAPPTTCRASVARYGQAREKRSVCGEPAGYELSEEPHALRLARLPLREKPERSVHVQVGARHPYQ